MREYSTNNLKRAIEDPKSIWREGRRVYGDIKNSYHGIDFVNETWDNLIILDGCRFDLFESSNIFNYDLEMKKSNASGTPEFLRKNFHGGIFNDTVYISANPHLDTIEAAFHEVVRLWETDWNDSTGTVLPADAADRAIEINEKYPDKRLITHFIQPHRPFLGETAKQMRQSQLVGGGVILDKPEVDFWWTRLEKGDLDRDIAWRAYTETLEETLPHVKRLVDNLSGLSVVSADHGNAFGEDSIYGHPVCTHHWSLVNVPWLEIRSGTKSIIPEDANVKTHEQSHDVEDQLADLGYV